MAGIDLVYILDARVQALKDGDESGEILFCNGSLATEDIPDVVVLLNGVRVTHDIPGAVSVNDINLVRFGRPHRRRRPDQEDTDQEELMYGRLHRPQVALATSREGGDGTKNYMGGAFLTQEAG